MTRKSPVWKRFALVPEAAHPLDLQGWFASWPDLQLLAVVCREGQLQVLEFCWNNEVFRVQIEGQEISLFCQNPCCSRVLQQKVLQQLLNTSRSGVWKPEKPQRVRGLGGTI